MKLNLICPYCNTQLLNDSGVISRHLRERHGIMELDSNVLEAIESAKENSNGPQVVNELDPAERVREPKSKFATLKPKRYSAQPTGGKNWKGWGSSD